jgi:hypothetical protein
LAPPSILPVGVRHVHPPLVHISLLGGSHGRLLERGNVLPRGNEVSAHKLFQIYIYSSHPVISSCLITQRNTEFILNILTSRFKKRVKKSIKCKFDL